MNSIGLAIGFWLAAASCALSSVCLAHPGTHGAIAVLDRMQEIGGAPTRLPFHEAGKVEAGECVEFRALETGTDVRLALEVDGARILGSDAEVSRFGLQLLVYCSIAPKPYAFSMEASGVGTASPRLVKSTWKTGGGISLRAQQSMAQAFSGLSEPARAGETARAFAEAAAAFDTVNDREHAAAAWMLAARRAEVALDRALAGAAFKAANTRLEALAWTRDRVVLLNNRALFVAAEDTVLAQRLIQESFRLQETRLHDALLADVVENNRCLLRHQYDDPGLAQACFARVLADQTARGASPANIGATRNNLGLVQLKRGQYAKAEPLFKQAAAERLRGGSGNGYVVSIGNLALCLYQLGHLEEALNELHGAMKFARDGADEIGAARIGGYLAAIYLAWGDSDTANTFAIDSEAVYRRTARIADLAPALRLRARIEAERGDLDSALAVAREAWELATNNGLAQAAANIAGVYAYILAERGEYPAAQRFIDDAQSILGGKFAASDLLNLRLVELGVLRRSGRKERALVLARKLLGNLPYAGQLRIKALIERHLLDCESGETTATECRKLYANLLDEVRGSVGIAPDPELALRLMEIARPAAEATIAQEARRCDAHPECAEQMLRRALEYFSLEPTFDPQPAADDRSELSGLLQALSALQTGDDPVAAAVLKRRIRQLLPLARMQGLARPGSACNRCALIDAGAAHVVFFFGDVRSWRWQRSGTAWHVQELPGWPHWKPHVRSLEHADARGDAIAALSPLITGLEAETSTELGIAGDPRLTQIPLAALELADGERVLDRYAVNLQIADGGVAPVLVPTAIFLTAQDMPDRALAMVDTEREVVRQWAGRVGLTYATDPAGVSGPATLLHIAAHGQRDMGGGTSVVWVKGRPVLSYLPFERIAADTVVINACDSAATSNFGLSQSSIAAGFLKRGARHVVATLFPVPDGAALGFAKAFYQSYGAEKNSVAGATRAAQLGMKQKRYPEYAWAAYTAVSRNNHMAN